MAALDDVIRRIVEFYGFTVTERSSQVMRAEKDKSVLVVGMLHKGTATDAHIGEFMDLVRGGADRYAFASLGAFSDGALGAAGKSGVLIWDKEHIEKELGKVMLADMAPEQPEVPADDEDVELEEVDIDQEEMVELEEAEPEEMVEIEDVPQDEAEGFVEEGEPEYAEEVDGIPLGAAETIMRLNYNIDDVTEISKKIVQGFRFDLELIPYYVFDYVCELLVEGQITTKESKGTVAVNGLTGNVEVWSGGLDTTGGLDVNHTKLEPRIDPRSAYGAARDKTVDINTREVETVEDRGSVTIFEKKKMSPKEGAIEIFPKGLVYQPVWCVEGSNGIMVIHGTSGKVLKEDLYRDSGKAFYK